MMAEPLVSIVMGSDSDLEVMREAGNALEGFGIAYEMDVTSAHRSPDRTADYARNAAGRGIRVIIAGAGGAAHLAGVIAAHTTLPVIGVPISATSLNGMDSLLATVQMPAGIPVATVAIGKPGASNAGILAAQILGLSDAGIAQKLAAHKQKLARGVEEKSKKLKSSLGGVTKLRPAATAGADSSHRTGLRQPQAPASSLSGTGQSRWPETGSHRKQK